MSTALSTEGTFKASLCIIGNEILSGRTHDSNTPWLAERFVRLGLVLVEVRIVQDIEEEIITAVNDLRAKSDYVFTTGGIGPTHDDITAQSVAKALGVELELNDEAYQALVKHYGSEEEVTPARKKMAMIPAGARLIPNPVSGAPGFVIENVHVMAGVPRIMHAMFDDIASKLEKGKPVLSNTVTCKLPESAVAEELMAMQKHFPTVDIGSYPHYRGGELGLSIVLRSTDNDNLDRATQGTIALIRKLGGEPNALSIMSSGEVVGGV